MRLFLEAEDRIRLDLAGEGFEVISEGPAISPYHLLAGSLASCTALTVGSWAQVANLTIDVLTLSVSWKMAETRHEPGRPDGYGSPLAGLPAERVATAERAADLCPVHATLKRATEISRRVATS